jgi:hypothetical protein
MRDKQWATTARPKAPSHALRSFPCSVPLSVSETSAYLRVRPRTPTRSLRENTERAAPLISTANQLESCPPAFQISFLVPQRRKLFSAGEFRKFRALAYYSYELKYNCESILHNFLQVLRRSFTQKPARGKERKLLLFGERGSASFFPRRPSSKFFISAGRRTSKVTSETTQWP